MRWRFDRELRQSENLTVTISGPIGAITCGPDGQVEAAEIRPADGRCKLVRAKSFVLNNGTIEISRLPQMLGHEGRKTPRSDTAWVGSVFMDHVDCYAGSVVPIGNRCFSDLFDNDSIAGVKYSPRPRLCDKVQVGGKQLKISTYIVFSHAKNENIANPKSGKNGFGLRAESLGFSRDFGEFLILPSSDEDDQLASIE